MQFERVCLSRRHPGAGVTVKWDWEMRPLRHFRGIIQICGCTPGGNFWCAGTALESNLLESDVQICSKTIKCPWADQGDLHGNPRRPTVVQGLPKRTRAKPKVGPRRGKRGRRTTNGGQQITTLHQMNFTKIPIHYPLLYSGRVFSLFVYIIYIYIYICICMKIIHVNKCIHIYIYIYTYMNFTLSFVGVYQLVFVVHTLHTFSDMLGCD